MADTLDFIAGLDAEEQRFRSDDSSAIDAFAAALGQEQQRTSSIRAAVVPAVKIEPERAARIGALVRESGLPDDVVARNPEAVHQNLILDRWDAAAAKSPLIAKVAAQDPQFVAVAQDDLDNLSLVEKFGGYLAKGARSFAAALPSASAGIGGAMEAGAETASRVLGPLASVILPQDPFAVAAEHIKRMRQSAKSTADTWRGDVSKAGATERGVLSGLESAGQMALTLPPALLTGNAAPVLSILSAITGGQSYSEARDAGQSVAKSLTYGGTQGAIEAATEMLPMSRLLSDLAKRTKLLPMLAGQLATEIPGEQLATLLQDMNQWAALNPEKTAKEFLAERPGAAYQTLIATITTVGVVTGSGRAAQAVVDRVAERDAALKDARTLDDLAKASQESKLRERDPARFAAFVNDATDQSDLFIDAQAFAQSAAAAGADINQILAAVPELKQQYFEAVQTGADLQLTTGDVMAHLVPAMPGIVDHVRTDPDAMSRAEAVALNTPERQAELTAELEAVEQQAVDAEDAVIENELQVETLRTEVVDRLVAAGTTKAVAEQQAVIPAAFYNAMSSRLGVSVEQLAKDLPLPGIVREGVSGYAQSAQVQTPEFRNWFGDSKVVDEKGAPLVVYHGTAADIEAFSPKASSDGAFYFAADPEVANEYAEIRRDGTQGTAPNVVPAYLSLRNPLRLDFGGASWGSIPFDSLPAEIQAAHKPHQITEMRDGRREVGLYTVAAAANELGYDGVIASNIRDGAGSYGYNNPGDVYIAFEPTQIKSATGNSGAFDPANPSILQQGKGQRGAFDPSRNTIALLKDADLSTFLHETGHFYLEALVSLATRENAAKSVVDDVETIMKWIGTDLQAWQGMTLDQRRERHEQFARGFEMYLAEGKAPTPELTSAFRRFAAWLKSVYKNLKALNVELTDEVRGVFDRMLATDEQLAQDETTVPFFDVDELRKMGLNDDYITTFATISADAVAEAQETLSSRSIRAMRFARNATAREVKRLTAEMQENRKQIEQQVRADVMAEPVFQARKALQDADAKLDLDALREMYGAEGNAIWRHLPTGKRGLAGKSGAHPDIVAEQFGFSSGDQLVRALVEAGSPEPHIEALTDTRMLEEHGDLIDADQIRDAAEAAVASDVRVRMVAAESFALDQSRGIQPLTARKARAFAEATIDGRQVRRLQPSLWKNAELRAVRNAKKMMEKDEFQAASAYKHQQLLAAALRTQAVRARERAEKDRRYLERVLSSTTIDPEYRDQIAAMLEGIQIKGQPTQRELDSRESLRAFLAKQEEAGLSAVIDPDVVERAMTKHWSELTVGELKAIVDGVKSIEHIGRLKHKLLTARDEREFGARVAEAVASIKANATKTLPRELTAPSDTVQWLRSFRAEHRKFSSLVREMDGADGGVMWTLLARSMNEAGDAEAAMREHATVALSDILAPVLKMKGGLAGDKRYFASINASLSRGERLAVALNLGNDGNRQRLRDGHGWTDAQVREITDTLTTAAWNTVQGVWDYIETYWPYIQAKELRVAGVAPEKVEASPFMVKPADSDQTFALKGGYYPVAADPRLGDKAASNEAAEVARDMLRGAYTRSTTRRGHTKARSETSSQPLQLSLDPLFRHVNQVVHDLTHHEWLIDANRLLSNAELSAAIRSHYGPDLLKTMRDQLRSIAAGDLPASMSVDKLVNGLRNRTSAAVMGWSLTTALLQPFGLAQSVVRIGPKHVAAGIGQALKDAASLESSVRKIGEKSEFMRLRAKTMNRELHELKGQVRQQQSKFGRAFDWSLFVLMQKFQMIADVPTWLGAHAKALAEGNDAERAVALADQAVIDAQGSGMTKDLAQIQQGGSIQRVMTLFYSYFSTTYNLTAESFARLDPKSAKSVGGFMADMALLYVIPSLGPWLLLSALRGGGDDDKDLADWLIDAAREVGGFALGAVVGLRELSGMVAGFDTYSGPPAFRLVSSAYKAAKQVQQGEAYEAAIRAVGQTVGTALGLPVTQIDRSWRGAKAFAEGEAGPGAVLFGPQQKD